MTPSERALLAALFDRIDRTPVPPRDAEADAYIHQRIAANPAATYAMAQTIAVQQQALAEAERRLQAAGIDPAATGVTGATGRPHAMAAEADAVSRRNPWRSAESAQASVPPAGARPAAGGAGSFLAGAAQVAMGVAGGALIAQALGGLFGADAAAADAGAQGASAEPADLAGDDAASIGEGAGMDGVSGDDGGLFGGLFEDW